MKKLIISREDIVRAFNTKEFIQHKLKEAGFDMHKPIYYKDDFETISIIYEQKEGE